MASNIKLKNNINSEFTVTHEDNQGAISVSSTDLAKVVSVDTIADLRATTKAQPTVWVSGYHTKGDGAFGSNIFEWDATSTEDDNGGTIIKLDSVATGRYKLKYSGSVNVKWFGAKGDGVTDDTVAIQDALDSGNTTIYFDEGSYVVGQLVIKDSIKLDGNNSTLLLTGSNAGFTTVSSLECSYIEIKNFNIEGDGVVSNRHMLFSLGTLLQVKNLVIENNKVNNCVIGITAGFENGSSTKNCEITNNTITNIVGTNPGEGYGLHVANSPTVDSTYSSGLVKVTNNIIDNASRHSIYFARGSNGIIKNNTILNHRKDVHNGAVLSAIAIFRSSDVICESNTVKDFYSCALMILPEVDYPSNNIVVKENVFTNGLELSYLYVGYLSYVDLELKNILISDNVFSGSPAKIQFKLGRNVNITNNIFYTDSTSHCIVIEPLGETAGTANYSSNISFSNNSISSSSSGKCYRINVDSAVDYYFLDNTYNNITTVFDAPIGLPNANIVATNVDYYNLQGITFDVYNIAAPYRSFTAGLADPNGTNTVPRYIGEELFATQTNAWWKSVGATQNDWVKLSN